MKRYDIGIEGGDWMTAASLDITEQDDGEWVKWEDVKAAHISTAKRVYLLEYALRRLAETAERCDGWDSFPSEALEKVYKALDTFF